MTEKKKVDRLFVDKKDLDLFNRLKEKDSPFAGCSNKEIFLAAMVTGFFEGSKLELQTREGYVREEYLHPQDKALINAIAVSEAGDLKVLLDKQKVFSIAEEYATGGIVLLKAKALSLDEYGSYAKKLESQMLREYEKFRQIMPEKPIAPEDLDGLDIQELISKGENNAVEFKSSLIWDCKKNGPSKDMKIIVVRAISSFMNSDGGFVIIGVDNFKKVIGLQNDIALSHHSTDELELTLTNAVNTYIGKINLPYMRTSFHKIENQDLIVIRVTPSPHPVYLRAEGKDPEFYIRSGNSTQKLDISEAPQYIEEHWS